MMTESKATGAWGEIYSSRYLRGKGYSVLCANYRSKSGEIDLVAEKDGVICFVEVKTRSEGQFFSPAEAVDSAKEENIKNTASAFMSQLKRTDKIRFDIIEVILDNKTYRIRHIINAF